jgi:hypothetical protein
MSETDGEFYRRTLLIPTIEGALFDKNAERYSGWDEETVILSYREYSALSQLLDYLVDDCPDFPQDLVDIVRTLAGLIAGHAEASMRRLGRLSEQQLPESNL